MGADAVINFGGDLSAVESTLNGIDSRLKSWSNGAKSIIGGVLGAAFFKQLGEGAGSAITAALEAADGQAKLAAQLKATGGAAGQTLESLNAMAQGLAEVTRFEDDAVTGAQSVLLAFTNIKGDTFDAATAAAADMAAALGTDLAQAADTVGKALNNPTQGARLLRSAGVELSESQKELIENLVAAGREADAQAVILGELQGRFGGVAEAMAQTSGGALANFQKRLGEVSEEIGGGILAALDTMAPALDGIVTLLEAAGAGFASIIASAAPFVNEIAVGIISFYERLQGLGVETFTVLQVGWENFGDVAEAAFASAQLSAIGFYEDLKFFFSDTVPTLLQYFGDNWRDIFTDVYNYVTTVVSNMTDNLVNFFNYIASFLTGGEASFEWKGLTEGFESSLKELPEIASRELTGTEKELQARLDELAGSLTDKFQDKLQENYAAAGLGPDGRPLAKPDANKLTPQAQAAKDAVAKATEARNLAEPPDADEKKKADKGKDKKTKKKPGDEDESLAGDTTGLTELAARISGASGKLGKDEKLLAEAEKQVKATTEVVKAVEKQAEQIVAGLGRVLPGALQAATVLL